MILNTMLKRRKGRNHHQVLSRNCHYYWLVLCSSTYSDVSLKAALGTSTLQYFSNLLCKTAGESLHLCTVICHMSYVVFTFDDFKEPLTGGCGVSAQQAEAEDLVSGSPDIFFQRKEGLGMQLRSREVTHKGPGIHLLTAPELKVPYIASNRAAAGVWKTRCQWLDASLTRAVLGTVNQISLFLFVFSDSKQCGTVKKVLKPFTHHFSSLLNNITLERFTKVIYSCLNV